VGYAMKSLADGLPPEIASQIDPEWRKNEAEYWAARDRLMSQYEHRWVGFADGKVIASGTSPVVVYHAAEQSGQHPFVTCVGHEHKPTRMRRVGFSEELRVAHTCSLRNVRVPAHMESAASAKATASPMPTFAVA